MTDYTEFTKSLLPNSGKRRMNSQRVESGGGRPAMHHFYLVSRSHVEAYTSKWTTSSWITVETRKDGDS
jgi:hypothetical protein